jgi:hypothetical protein
MSASAFVTIGDKRTLVSAHSVTLHGVESADVSVATIDDWTLGDGVTRPPFTTVRVVRGTAEATLFVVGSPAERAEALRRFAATLTDAAAELEASEGVAV